MLRPVTLLSAVEVPAAALGALAPIAFRLVGAGVGSKLPPGRVVAAFVDWDPEPAAQGTRYVVDVLGGTLSRCQLFHPPRHVVMPVSFEVLEDQSFTCRVTVENVARAVAGMVSVGLILEPRQ